MGMWLRESQWSLTFEVRKRVRGTTTSTSDGTVAMEPDL